jgi:hypothetical protein
VALGYNIIDRGSFGDLNVRVVDITLDNAYPAGGWALSPQSLGFGQNGIVYGVILFSDGTGRFVSWDRVNNKLMVRDASGAANAASPEITTATQMSGAVVRAIALGKGHG